MNILRLLGMKPDDIGIDLGTANTLISKRDGEIILQEPSVVAIHKGTENVLAVGDEAKNMLGKTPGDIVASRPLKDGVIADFQVAEAMLRYFIRKASNFRNTSNIRVLIAVPSSITEVERRAVEESARNAGVKFVRLMEEPMAAAIGVGLPVREASGSMIIDIGGGTTEIAIISLGGIVYSTSVRVAGDALDEAIMQYMKRNHSMLVGERTAEEIKIKLGTAINMPDKKYYMDVKGRDMVSGMPKTLKMSSEQILEAFEDPLNTVIDAVKTALERCPPELSADLVDRGMTLAGGGALLKGLDLRLRKETGLPVHVAEDPLCAVVRGTGIALDNIELLTRVSKQST